jgi:hypothetical protein
MEIRKLAASDYDQLIELYAQLDEYLYRPDPIALCIGRRMKYIPRMRLYIIWHTPVVCI